MEPRRNQVERTVRIPAESAELEGSLNVPEGASGMVLFAHGSGSSRHSPRNQAVAAALRGSGLGTLLIDLLTAEEEREEAVSRHHRFNIELLAERLLFATDWLWANPETAHLPIGYFGASTGAGAALVAAAERPETVRAVVSRGGRPDLAGEALTRVRAPTLLIVGGNDPHVITLNEAALRALQGPKEMVIIPGASHLFEEPGALDQVAQLAADWFKRWMGALGVRHLALG